VPARDPSVPARPYDAFRLVYDPVPRYGVTQVDADPAAIDPRRFALLRGRVLNPQGDVLGGTLITVTGHPEYGWTKSRFEGGVPHANAR
jgi:hypothetical protein